MGVIRNGTISGQLPSTKVFAVHYPGYPSSISEAVNTLGGANGIAKARSSNPDRLELRFRPDDPSSHPACGQLHSCNNFLLKISRRKRHFKGLNNSGCDISCSGSARNELEKPDTSDGLLSSEVVGGRFPDTLDVHLSAEMVGGRFPDTLAGNLSADIVGRVEESYHFSGMPDYQLVLPIHADVARKKQRILTEFDNSYAMGTPALDENLMSLLPPLFSLKDIPENLVLRPSSVVSSKKKLEGVVQHRWEMEIEPCLAIDSDIKEIPKEVNWEKHISKGSDQWKLQMAVSKLFEERPIWPKASVSERLATMGFKFVEKTLKRLLFRVAYYFGSGPFHRFWIKKGYDPRQDPESRIYQRLDYRLPPNLKVNSNMTNGKEHTWEDICSFRVFPSKYQTHLQLCELSDDYIQQKIREAPKQSTCMSTTGWFSPHVLNSLRLRIAMRFLSLYPYAGAERLLKDVTERFEKSKKIYNLSAHTKPSDEGESQGDAEPGTDGEKEGDNDEEENEIEEEEVEDDDAEDPYAYDVANLDAEEASFSLLSDSYQGGENASKDYLQGLFGSFSSTLGENTVKNTSNDDEYHIYEQDSGGSGSDDDY